MAHDGASRATTCAWRSEPRRRVRRPVTAGRSVAPDRAIGSVPRGSGVPGTAAIAQRLPAANGRPTGLRTTPARTGSDARSLYPEYNAPHASIRADALVTWPPRCCFSRVAGAWPATSTQDARSVDTPPAHPADAAPCSR
jgi:hypothetical protein